MSRADGRISTAEPGKTLGQVARVRALDLAADAAGERIDATTPTRVLVAQVRTYVLGPGGEVSVMVDPDGEVVAGWYSYYESGGHGQFELSLSDAMMIYEALERKETL